MPQCWRVEGKAVGMLIPNSAFGTDKLNPSDLANTNANIVSCLQGGCFFGSLIAPWFADRFGRKPALLIFSAVCTIGVIIQTASSGHIAAIDIGRYAPILVYCHNWYTEP